MPGDCLHRKQERDFVHFDVGANFGWENPFDLATLKHFWHERFQEIQNPLNKMFLELNTINKIIPVFSLFKTKYFKLNNVCQRPTFTPVTRIQNCNTIGIKDLSTNNLIQPKLHKSETVFY